MIAWTQIENALHTWIRTASGLAADRVLWGAQNIERPTAPWISLRVTAIARVGQDWTDREIAAVPTPGAEIVYQVRGCREAQLSIQCFGGDATGASMCAAVLDQCLLMTAAPHQRAAFRTAGVAVGAAGPVQALDGVLGSTRFEPRAQLGVTLHFAHETSIPGTNVLTAGVTTTIQT